MLPGCPQDYHPIVVPQKNLTGAVLRLPDALPTNVGSKHWRKTQSTNQEVTHWPHPFHIQQLITKLPLCQLYNASNSNRYTWQYKTVNIICLYQKQLHCILYSILVYKTSVMMTYGELQESIIKELKKELLNYYDSKSTINMMTLATKHLSKAQ